MHVKNCTMHMICTYVQYVRRAQRQALTPPVTLSCEWIQPLDNGDGWSWCQ